LVVLAEDDEEAELDALELDSDFLVSGFFVSDELFDSLVDEDELAAGVSLELAATVLDDLASERASLR
jgi:hypothetical protein